MRVSQEHDIQTRLNDFRELWHDIVPAVAGSFRMDEDEHQWLSEKPVARLIGAIPFIAGCDQPERTAVAHLGVYLLSVLDTKPFFNAAPTDDADVLDRLRLIMSFRDGDARIIDRGMCLLALNMLDDYARDIQIDAALGKYNPVASGAWDYDAVRADLVRRIESVHCPQMDEIFDPEYGPTSFWGRS